MSSGMIFVLAIVAIIAFSRIVSAGMARESRKSRRDGGGSEAFARLERENAALRRKVEQIESRTAVLERIATDAPARLTAQIDEL